MTPPLLRSLAQVYEDAGGAEGVERILTAFYEKMSKDVLIGYFFAGKDLKPIIHQQKNFLLKAMGARKSYGGKSPRAAHQKIPPILKGHFDRRLVILRQTLEEFHLPPESIEAWVNFEDTFRKGIVEEEGPISKRRKYLSGNKNNHK